MHHGLGLQTTQAKGQTKKKENQNQNVLGFEIPQAGSKLL